MSDINGDVNDNRIIGTDAADNIFGLAGNDFIYAGAGNDNVSGGDGTDMLVGGPGNDILRGGAATDVLLGTEGDDLLAGGGGNDTLAGGTGLDELRGGVGADVFGFSSPNQGLDTITDFNISEGDKIQVTTNGFGIGLGDFSGFSYDGASGILSFKGTQLAQLSANLAFVPSDSITII